MLDKLIFLHRKLDANIASPRTPGKKIEFPGKIKAYKAWKKKSRRIKG